MAKRYEKTQKGVYIPKHPEKWTVSGRGLGEGKIVYRSSWERMFMAWADNHPNVYKIASEEVVIPYRSPIDGQIHRYYVDFVIELKDKDGNIVRKLIEIKPSAQTKRPRKRKSERDYINECKTYAVNLAKWEAAKKWAKKHGMDFVIITEYELGLKQRRGKK